VRPPQTLSAKAGAHRFLWDMHLPPTPGVETGYPIAAIPHNTAPEASSPWVMPGQYTVVLTANGKSYTQPLVLQIDPRVKTPRAGLETQYTASRRLYDGATKLAAPVEQATAIRKQLERFKANPPEGETAAALKDFMQKLQSLAGGGGGRRGGRGAPEQPSLAGVQGQMMQLMGVLQDADVAPTKQALDAIPGLEKNAADLQTKWSAFLSQELPAFNAKLRAAGVAEINATPEQK
jgi:hypothetical protein